MDGYADYVENVRFEMAGVHVITAHVVGSNNNFETRDLAAANEFSPETKQQLRGSTQTSTERSETAQKLSSF